MDKTMYDIAVEDLKLQENLFLKELTRIFKVQLNVFYGSEKLEKLKLKYDTVELLRIIKKSQDNRKAALANIKKYEGSSNSRSINENWEFEVLYNKFGIELSQSFVDAILLVKDTKILENSNNPKIVLKVSTYPVYEKLFREFKQTSNNFLYNLVKFFNLPSDFKYTKQKTKIETSYNYFELYELCKNSKQARLAALEKLKQFEPNRRTAGKSVNENWEEDVLLATFDIKL